MDGVEALGSALLVHVLVAHIAEELLHALGHVVLVEHGAPRHELVHLAPQPLVGALPLQDQIVQVLVAQLLTRPALPGTLAALLQLVGGLHLSVKFLFLL